MNEGQLGSHNHEHVWSKDAEGQILSHSRMQYVQKIRQVRHVSVNKQGKDKVNGTLENEKEYEYSKFPICKTNTGWFLCCNQYTHSDIADELGLGMSIYFKQLKNLVLMLAICTILSLPSYVLFWSGDPSNNKFSIEDPKAFFSTFTLGNLGQSSL